MDNLKRFKSSLGTYDWMSPYRWSEAVKPDFALVGRHYAGSGGGCVKFVEGQQVAVKNQTDAPPLAGYRLDLMGFPFYFGYEGYFMIEEHNQTAINLWCGQKQSLLVHAFKQSGGQVLFRQPPSTIQELLDRILFNPYLLSLGGGVTVNSMSFLSTFMRLGPMIDSAEAGNLITKKIYERREFAFLETFSTESWAAILASMLVLSLLTCLSGRSASQKNQSKKFLLRSGRRRYRWPGQITGGHGKLLRSWPAILLEFGGLLWGEADFTLDRYHRGLTSLWLATCTILVGCLSGSLRDMMSNATQILVPETWDDFWSYPWQNHTLVTTSMLQSWDDFCTKYGSEVIEDLDRQVRLVVFPPRSDKMALVSADPLEYLKQFVYIFQDLSHHILLGFRRFFLASIWGTQVARRTAVEVLTYYYTGEDTQAAADMLDALMSDIYEHVALSPGNSAVYLYFPFMRSTPREVEHYLNRFLGWFHENGMAHLMGAGTDDRIQSKILSHQEAKAGATVLRSEDFFGPALLDAGFLLCACAVLFIELFHRTRQRRVCTMTR